MGVAPASAARSRGLPRVVTFLGIPLLCLLLIAVFSVAVFPYDRFASIARSQLSAATGAQVTLGDLEGGLSVGGPALTARDVRLTWPDGTRIDVSQAKVRPAWSLSWLRGRPALAIALESPQGEIRGTGWPNGPPEFSGRLENVAIEALPPALLSRLPLTGNGAGDVDLRFEDDGPRGRVELDLRDGALTMQELPMGVPYETLAGELVFGDGGAVNVKDVALNGPVVALTAQGKIGAAPRFALAPLDLDIEYQVVDANLRPILTAQGARLDGEGRGRARIGGTPTRPSLR